MRSTCTKRLPISRCKAVCAETALLGPRNFFNLHPFLTLRLTRQLSLTTDVDFFWRLERHDGLYNPGGGLLRSGTHISARFIGTEASTSIAWTTSDRITATAVYARFFAGPFLKASGAARDVDFIELTLRAQF
jgi:hypothetical protein